MSSLSIVLLSVLVLLILLIVMYFYFNNREVALRNEADAQLGKIETARDTMFKVIQEQANVSSDYRDAFGRIYPEIIAGRYERGGELMKFIQEANPTFDTSLYKALTNSIEIQRTAFKMTQDRLLDIIRQHKNLLQQKPSGFFIHGKLPIVYEPIAALDTKSVMSTHQDDYVFKF